MTGVDMVLSSSRTKATRKMIDNGVAGRNMMLEQWAGYLDVYQTRVCSW